MLIKDVTKHSKRYKVKSRNPETHTENMMGYDVVKLTEDFTFTVYGNEFTAKAGEYLAQCMYFAPIIIKDWKALNKGYVIFRKASKEFQKELSIV